MSTNLQRRVGGSKRPIVRYRHLGPQSPLGQVLAHALLLVFSFLTLTPFVWTLIQSFQPTFSDGPWTTDNYTQVMSDGSFEASYLNSAIVAVSVTLSAVVTSLLVGFVLAKYRFRGKELLFIFLIAALMIPFSAILLPVYVTLNHLGFDNRIGGLIVVGLWSPFGLFTVRQFMEGIPSELLDASRIDGASEWRIVAQLMMPLCSSALTVVGVYSFSQSWDNFLLPALLLRDPMQSTLPVLLSSGLGATTATASATVVLTTLPALAITVVAVTFFLRGIGLASVQG